MPVPAAAAPARPADEIAVVGGLGLGIARVEQEIAVARLQRHLGRAQQQIILHRLARRGGVAGEGHAIAVSGELLVGIAGTARLGAGMIGGGGLAPGQNERRGGKGQQADAIIADLLRLSLSILDQIFPRFLSAGRFSGCGTSY